MSRPKYHLSEEEVVRREIINRTYQRAIAEGDKNIHFIRGDQLIPKEVAEAALVDNCHPTDIGFFYMAKALLPVIKEYIK